MRDDNTRCSEMFLRVEQLGKDEAAAYASNTFIKELFDIRFHLTRGVFLALVPGLQARIVLEREKVFGLISSALEQARGTFGELPAGELAVSRVQQIMRRMQVIGAMTDPSEDEITSQFVRTKLRPSPGTTPCCSPMGRSRLQEMATICRSGNAYTLHNPASSHPSRWFRFMRAAIESACDLPIHEIPFRARDHSHA